MRHMLKVFILVTLAVFVLSSTAMAWGDKEVTETFDAKDLVTVKTVSGNCVVKKGDNDKIHVRVVYDVEPDDVYEPILRERDNSLKLVEEIHGSCSGESEWIITVPEGTRVKFSSASGEFEAEGLSGDFEVSTASGDIQLIGCKGVFELSSASGHVIVEDCEGEFELSSASGRVEGSEVHISDPSNFSSASGNVEVVLGASPEYDLSISSASGRAVLDFNGHPLEGRFEMVSKERGGRIDSSVKFDSEESFRRHGERYIAKTFSRGSSGPEIQVHTASGRAVLREN